MSATATRSRGTRALSRSQSRQATLYGRKARENQAATAGRAIPASRDADLVRTGITTSLVRKAARAIDADATLVAWVEGKVAASQGGPGRPAGLSVRSTLMCLWLLNVSARNCHLINLPALVANLDPRVRRHLGIDYLDRAGNPRQVSYHQLLRAFHNVADAFDPFAEGLSEDEARARAADLQEFTSRMVRASVDNHAHVGNYAVDATLVWAWDRPPGSMGNKVERRGRDGDNGPPLSLGQVLSKSKSDDPDFSDDDFIDDPFLVTRAEQVAAEQRAAEKKAAEQAESGQEAAEQEAGKAKSKRRNVRRKGAKWVGHGKNKAKAVYGYALHTATVTDPGSPSVIEALAVTPAPAHPAKSAVPLLRELHDARCGDAKVADLVDQGAARLLGNVVADPAYSANVNEWHLPIRAMGGSAIFRLHRTTQAGRKVVAGSTFVDGRPYCSCIPQDLATLEFPKFPYKRAELDAFQAGVELRKPFEMLPNGAYRPNGNRQFRTPHFAKPAAGGPGNGGKAVGGCEHCVDAMGNAVIDEATKHPRVRCCIQRTHVFTGHNLGMYQDEAFGTREWEKLWNPRNRVEGSYGVMKGLSLVNWGHDYHHFTGLARETLVATFAVMSYNFHMQRTWKARKRLAEGPPARPGSLPSAQPTQTLPDSVASADQAASAAEREASPRGPKGLEVLGTPRRAGP